MSEQSLTIRDDRTGKSYTLPIENGTVRAMDFRQIKTDADDFGLMTYDPALMNTASTKSVITFIDGDKGILEYRGYPVEELAQRSNFLEIAYLILFGELPNKQQLAEWTYDITHHTFVHENIKTLMQAFRYDAHPMGISSALSLHFQRFIPTLTRSVMPTIDWHKLNASSRRCRRSPRTPIATTAACVTSIPITI
jgi:citrate synthase